MKLTFEEKKLLYTYGCADLELTRKRLCEIAGLTVDPDQNKLVLDLWRTKRWQTGTTRCSTSSVSRWSVMPGWRSWRRTSSVMRIGGLRCLRKTKMTNSLTMFKLETMIYASEDGTNSVFTLNSALQKQLNALATQHPVVCQRKARGEAGGVTYQVRGAALAIQPVRGIDLL